MTDLIQYFVAAGTLLVAVGALIGITKALVKFIHYLRRPRPELTIEKLEYQEDKEKIHISIRNTGQISVENVQYVIEIMGHKLEVPNQHTYSYDASPQKSKTIVSFRQRAEEFKPAEKRNLSITARKKESGEIEMKIIINHSGDQCKIPSKLHV